MKRLLSMLCILSMLFTAAGCAFSKTYTINYDDIMVYVTPVTQARPGDVVTVVVNAQECASFLFYTNDALLSAHTRDEYFITYEFVMPFNNVTITHIEQEELTMNQLTIPATMRTYRIDYSTPYSFEGEYVIVTNREESEKLFAGFSLRNTENIQPYPKDFFENNILIACVQYEGSGSVTHSLKNVTLNNDQLFVTITRNVPSIGTCDIATHLCLISVSKKALPEDMSVIIQIEDNYK